MRDTVNNVLSEVKKVVIGKDEVILNVFMAVLAEGHVLLEDVPGVGKTTLALALARVLGLETKRIQFTSDTVPSDVIGLTVPDKKTGEFVYKPGAIMTNILLADEINRTSSKTQSALLEAMEERHVTVDGETHELPSPFIVLATENPFGFAGTLMLPHSQLDRFMIRTSMGYPSFESQISILKDRATGNPLDEIRPIVTKDELLKMISEVKFVHMDDGIYEYITALTEATRKHSMVSMGVSPRGALALCSLAKAKAYVSGRDYCVPEDVADAAPLVFAHRIILNSKARFNEVTADDVVKEIIDQVKMPVLKEFH